MIGDSAPVSRRFPEYSYRCHKLRFQ